MSEQFVAASGLRYTIIRPVFIYGKTWPAYVPVLHWVKQNLETGNRIKVVSDQLRTPTYVEDICNGIYTVIMEDKWELFILREKTSSHLRMAVTIAKLWDSMQH